MPSAVAAIRAADSGRQRTCRQASTTPRRARLRSTICAGVAIVAERIFVRDFVLPVRIGAYSHEKQARRKKSAST